MAIMTTLIASLPLLAACCWASPFHHGAVESTLNLSQGFRRGDTVFFLADHHRYRRGRTFWFILPLKAGPKTLSHRTALYCLDTRSRALTQEAVLADPAELTCMLGYVKWTLRDGALYFSYNPSNRLDRNGHTVRALFRRDMATGMVERIADDGKLEAELFSGYKSPWTANPGVTGIADYKPLLPAGEWDLPQQTPQR
jgi:hypothetical protein